MSTAIAERIWKGLRGRSGSTRAVIVERTRLDLGRVRRKSTESPNLERFRGWDVELRRQGFFVAQGFLPPDVCTQLRVEIDRLLGSHPEAVSLASEGSDRRIFGAENGSELVRSYARDSVLGAMCRRWLGPKAELLCTLANRVEAKPGNLGSGSGWHRDSLAGQFKTILYLNDVTDDNGPFQYVSGSHTTRSVLRDGRAAGLPVVSTRFREGDVRRIVRGDAGRLVTLTAPAGTLIVADTTGIHRGAPLVRGLRYALTNYYYPEGRRLDRLREHFRPILGFHVPVAR